MADVNLKCLVKIVKESLLKQLLQNAAYFKGEVCALHDAKLITLSAFFWRIDILSLGQPAQHKHNLYEIGT